MFLLYIACEKNGIHFLSYNLALNENKTKQNKTHECDCMKPKYD